MVMANKAEHTLVLFGKTGSGKSSILNYISGIKDKFVEGEDLKSKTKTVDNFIGPFLNKPGEESCLFIDTPGFYDTDGEDSSHLKNMVDFLKEVREGFTLLCFALPLTEIKFDASIQLSLKMLCTLFGDEIGDKIRIIFTHYNKLKEKAAQEAINKFKSELPSLLTLSNIPYSENNKFYIFDYDNEDDGNLGELVEEIKILPKFQSEVLKTLDDLVQQGLDFSDPIKVLHILTENSKKMQEYTDKFNDLEKVILDLKEARKQSEERLRERDAKIAENNKQMLELQNEMLKASKEDKKRMDLMLQEHRNYLDQINSQHLQQMEILRKELKEREEETKRLHEEQRKQAQHQLEMERKNNLILQEKYEMAEKNRLQNKILEEIREKQRASEEEIQNLIQKQNRPRKKSGCRIF